MLNKFSLEGKVAIVTGARRGLGMGIALGLAQAGADIFGVDYDECSNVKAEVEKLGRRFVEFKANLIEQSDIDCLVETCIKEFGKVDILVNNAGIIRREDSLEFSEKDWDDVMGINLKTVFFLSQRVAKEFVKQGSKGKIINIGSLLSFQGGIRIPSYTASKSAVRGITMTLCNEWAKYNININAIAPGYMVTDNTEALRADKDRYNAILERIPAGRWGTPEDLAPTAVFLASEASDYINGYIIAVDGGWLGR